MTDLTRDIHLFISVARIEGDARRSSGLLQRLRRRLPPSTNGGRRHRCGRKEKPHDELEEMKKSRREVEKELREHEEHLKKSRGQTSLVKTNEEYTAMLQGDRPTSKRPSRRKKSGS
jgi:hypothetical protein